MNRESEPSVYETEEGSTKEIWEAEDIKGLCETLKSKGEDKAAEDIEEIEKQVKEIASKKSVGSEGIKRQIDGLMGSLTLPSIEGLDDKVKKMLYDLV